MSSFLIQPPYWTDNIYYISLLNSSSLPICSFLKCRCRRETFRLWCVLCNLCQAVTLFTSFTKVTINKVFSKHPLRLFTKMPCWWSLALIITFSPFLVWNRGILPLIHESFSTFLSFVHCIPWTCVNAQIKRSMRYDNDLTAFISSEYLMTSQVVIADVIACLCSLSLTLSFEIAL